VDIAEAQVLDGEPGSRQPTCDQGLATGIVRRHRRPRDQFAGEVEYVAHDSSPSPLGRGSQVQTPNSFLKPLSEKPCDTVPSSSTTTGRRISCGYSFSSSFHSASLPGALRFGGSCRQVVEDLLTSASQPPAASFHASSVSGDCRSSR